MKIKDLFNFRGHVHNWEDIGDREQRCVLCNERRVIDCAHVWELEESYTAKYVYLRGSVDCRILRCSKCGEFKTWRSDL